MERSDIALLRPHGHDSDDYGQLGEDEDSHVEIESLYDYSKNWKDSLIKL